VFEEVGRDVEGKLYATTDDKVAAVVADLEWLEVNPGGVIKADWH
jgi:hypothetical protein